MRLTLRTLLAYLDDSLEPAQAKAIGEKVAESEVAPELIERIKKVTRRRGLAAPPVSGDGEDATTDPNVVAEYLDNVLPPEQLAEVEESALQSDASLAEVAACHQILTLVLGEPVKVPPTARQRMYRVVRGRESIPYRKPAAAAVAGVAAPDTADENNEADEALLLGMVNTRLLVPVLSAAAIVILLVGVIWMAIPSPRPPAHQGYVPLAVAYRPDADVKKPPVIAEPKKKPDADAKKGTGVAPEKEPVAKDAPEVLPMPREFVANAGPPPDKEPKAIVTPPDKADPDRRGIARLETKDTVLLQRPRGGTGWEVVAPGKDLFSSDTLMALPGDRCTIKTDSGVVLTLWGSLPQYHSIPVLDILESRVTLHPPARDFAADFTLHSGRVFITRPVAKGAPAADPARVRVRFKDEIWDVTLRDGDSEVCVDLLGFYGEGVPFSKEPNGPAPKTEFYFGLLKGRAGLRVKFKEFPMLEAPTRVDWDSTFHEVSRPEKIKPTDAEWWNKTIPDHEGAKQMQAAVTYFNGRLRKLDDAKIEVIFFSAMQDAQEQPARRAYAAACLQALDAVEYLADAIADDYFVVRGVGIRAVQHWTGLSPERDLVFYRTLVDRKGYTESQAQTVMQLMHPLKPEDQRKPEIVSALFDAFRHEKVAVRELAYLHLAYIDPAGAKEAGFIDVAAPENMVDAQVQKWKASWKRRVIDKKK